MSSIYSASAIAVFFYTNQSSFTKKIPTDKISEVYRRGLENWKLISFSKQLGIASLSAWFQANWIPVGIRIVKIS